MLIMAKAYRTKTGISDVQHMGLHTLICCYLGYDNDLPFPDKADELLFAAFDYDMGSDNSYFGLYSKLNEDGSIKWLRGPHGETLFKALLARKGLSWN